MKFCQRHTIAYVGDQCPICALQDDIESVKDSVQLLAEEMFEVPAAHEELNRIALKLNGIAKKGWN